MRLNLPQLRPRREQLADGTTIEVVDPANLREILDAIRDWARGVDDDIDGGAA